MRKSRCTEAQIIGMLQRAGIRDAYEYYVPASDG